MQPWIGYSVPGRWAKTEIRAQLSSGQPRPAFEVQDEKPAAKAAGRSGLGAPRFVAPQGGAEF